MKIVQYCQHVLGIGHLVRTLEVLKALDREEVILVNGGLEVEFALPAHIRQVNLPPLVMDKQFKGLQPVEKGLSVSGIKQARRRRLFELFVREAPDVFLVELFPFGRRAFAFELEPLLTSIAEQRRPGCAVVCGVRDILVERGKHTDDYEREVVARLNRFFSGLLIHSDPAVIRLDDTFGRFANIAIPVAYTGFVAQQPAAGARAVTRRELGLTAADTLMIASAGSGKVGYPLLAAALDAFAILRRSRGNLHLIIFSGPFAEAHHLRQLQRRAAEGVKIIRFSPDFLSYLAAADVSLSMAGYNTCMNLLAVNLPALVWPFEQNREQRLRAERLQALGMLHILENGDLQPEQLAGRVAAVLNRSRPQGAAIQLDGARKSARWIRGHAHRACQ